MIYAAMLRILMASGTTSCPADTVLEIPMKFPRMALAALLTFGGSVVLAPAADAASLPHCTTTSPYYYYPNAYTTWTGNEPTAHGDPDCLLTQGDTGTAVTAVQRALVVCYHEPIEIDGVFGQKTKAAIADVQRQVNARYVDGIWGPESFLMVSIPYYYGRQYRGCY